MEQLTLSLGKTCSKGNTYSTVCLCGHSIWVEISYAAVPTPTINLSVTHTLASLTIGNSVTTIGNLAFASCTGLRSIEIPNSMTSIGDEAFAECCSLSSLTSYATMPPTCGTDAFDKIDKAACTLHVPAGTKSQYQAAPMWEDFKNIVEDAEMA